jgi:hypothetical protein
MFYFDGITYFTLVVIKEMGFVVPGRSELYLRNGIRSAQRMLGTLVLVKCCERWTGSQGSAYGFGELLSGGEGSFFAQEPFTNCTSFALAE